MSVRSAEVARGDSGRQARDAGADHNHVRGIVPAHGGALRARLVRADAGDCGGAHAGRALGQERSSADIDRRTFAAVRTVRRVLAHEFLPQHVVMRSS